MPKKKATLDEVLHATKQGFDAMNNKFAAVDRKFDAVENSIDKFTMAVYNPAMASSTQSHLDQAALSQRRDSHRRQFCYLATTASGNVHVPFRISFLG